MSGAGAALAAAGRVALVSGGSRGIGLAIARSSQASGWRLSLELPDRAALAMLPLSCQLGGLF